MSVTRAPHLPVFLLPRPWRIGQMASEDRGLPGGFRRHKHSAPRYVIENQWKFGFGPTVADRYVAAVGGEQVLKVLLVDNPRRPDADLFRLQDLSTNQPAHCHRTHPQGIGKKFNREGLDIHTAPPPAALQWTPKTDSTATLSSNVLHSASESTGTRIFTVDKSVRARVGSPKEGYFSPCALTSYINSDFQGISGSDRTSVSTAASTSAPDRGSVPSFGMRIASPMKKICVVRDTDPYVTRRRLT